MDSLRTCEEALEAQTQFGAGVRDQGQGGDPDDQGQGVQEVH